MSTESTLTSKGQTTIPKPIQDSLGMKAGDRMSFKLMPDRCRHACKKQACV
jgi:AbrB family looped-hinge helix DNA binding protein